MVGTIFVNSLSNICSNVAKNVVLAVEANHKKYDVTVLGNHEHLMTEWGVHISVGTVMYEQNKDVVLQFAPKHEVKDNLDNADNADDSVEGQVAVTAASPSKMYEVGAHSLTYISLRSGEVVNGAVKCFDDDNNPSDKQTDVHTFRLRACDVLRECMTDAKIRNFDAAQSKLRALIAEIQQFNNGAKDKYIADLLEDLTGQAFEAISNAEYYSLVEHKISVVSYSIV